MLLFWLLAFLIVVNAGEVSYASLKGFWENTYDPDKDGKASLEDFVNYFKLMEPDHDIRHN